MSVSVKDPDTAVQNRIIKIGSFELPIPAWCAPAFGVIAVLYVGYTLLNQPAQTAYATYLVGRTEQQDSNEAYKHFYEPPTAELHNTSAGGTLEAKLFRDGCVSVAWTSAQASAPPRPHFIRKVAADPGAPPAPQSAPTGSIGRDFPGMMLAGLGIPGGGIPAPWLERPVAAPSATTCLNPHPGDYSTSYGPHNGCWVQVWRQFKDGCQHYQWFNTCANVWDVNRDGSPRVYWSQCRH